MNYLCIFKNLTFTDFMSYDNIAKTLTIQSGHVLLNVVIMLTSNGKIVKYFQIDSETDTRKKKLGKERIYAVFLSNLYDETESENKIKK